MPTALVHRSSCSLTVYGLAVLLRSGRVLTPAVLIRTAKFVCVAKGGHHPHLTNAHEVASELRGWLVMTRTALLRCLLACSLLVLVLLVDACGSGKTAVTAVPYLERIAGTTASRVSGGAAGVNILV